MHPAPFPVSQWKCLGNPEGKCEVKIVQPQVLPLGHCAYISGPVRCGMGRSGVYIGELPIRAQNAAAARCACTQPLHGLCAVVWGGGQPRCWRTPVGELGSKKGRRSLGDFRWSCQGGGEASISSAMLLSGPFTSALDILFPHCGEFHRWRTGQV